ncbi:MAG: acyltransferase [Lachnospiraceae bacterium]|nr:acyltransferase [Lachnospiraceae bacterium]
MGKTENKVCYRGIDVMKFIMALFVVVLHTHPFVDVNDTLSFLTADIMGRVAVPFFFAATGFLLEKQIGQQKEKREIIAPYIRKLLILYCIWTVVYLPIIIYEKIIASDTSLTYDVFAIARDFFFAGSYAHLWYLPATAVGLVIVYVLRQYAGERECSIILFILFCMGLLTQSYFGLLLKIVPVYGLLWKLMKLVKIVMVTCRNGIFFGSIFLYMGMWIARCNIKAKTYIAVLGLSISIVLFTMEASYLQKTGMVREQDMYLILLPVVFFLVLFALSLTVRIDTVFLRKMSINIYFVHMIFKFVYRTFVGEYHDYGLHMFGFTLCGAFIVSYVMYLFGKRRVQTGKIRISTERTKM